MRQHSLVFSLTDNLFTADANSMVKWTGEVLLANLTYYRARRDLFGDFSRLVNHVGSHVVHISEEEMIVIRQFLTARNDVITDDKRLSFDKAILAVRSRAISNLPPAPVSLLNAVLGRGPSST